MPEDTAPFESSHNQHHDNAAHHGKFQPIFRILLELWLHKSVGLRIKRALEPSMRLSIAVQDIVADNEVIDLAIDEASVSVIGRADDRLAAHVERGIDQRSAASRLLESLEQSVEGWVLLAAQRLN